jgi:alanine-glyoxylate transaminase/(R)-3-amino-2-methylpropionate-pyruvate transaminase
MAIASTSPPRREKATSSKGAAGAHAPLKMPPTDHVPKKYSGPSRAELLAMRKQYTNPAIFTLYGEPLLIVEGHMQWLFDETGKRYLDMFAGIVTVSCGHCHPKVTARIKRWRRSSATTIYLHQTFRCWRRSCVEMPKGLDVTYFVNNGSEAMISLSRWRASSRATPTSSRSNGYHGGSPSSMG